MSIDQRLDELERRTTTGERLTFRVMYDGMPEPDGWEEADFCTHRVLWPVHGDARIGRETGGEVRDGSD